MTNLLNFFLMWTLGLSASSLQVPNFSVALTKPTAEVVKNVSGFFTIKNASDTDSFMNHHKNEDLYVFVVALHRLPSRAIYWDNERADYILDPGESVTLYANGNEEYIIRLGYSPNANDWRWQKTLTKDVHQIESFW